MSWIFFALLTPTFYSFTNILDKYLLDKRIKDPLALTALSGIITGCIGITIGFFTGFQFIGVLQILLLVFSGVLLLYYLIPYFAAMKLEDASRVVPLFQFIPVFTFILSAVFLKEFLTTRQIFGLMMVVVSGILLSLKKVDGSILTPRKSLWLMLVSSLMYGLIAILFRFVAKENSFWTMISYQYIGTGIGGVFLFLFPRIRNGFTSRVLEIKKSFGIVVVGHFLSMVAQVSESYAVTFVSVPLVNIIGSIQPVFVLVFGIILTLWFPHIIKEDIKKAVVAHKFVSVVFMFLGLILVYF
ncbi:EamA family transporter [Candidatus Gottesmanbacteria bacterium]|nr:EamA family transporter [Candidatus Gottesmanbacteria bacterium]